MNYTYYFINKIKCLAGFQLVLGILLFGTSFNQTLLASKPDSTIIKVANPFSPFYTAPLTGIMENESLIRAGLLYDVERKVIVWEKDMNYAYPVASLTKMMVALLAIEDIKNGKANWNDEVLVSRVYYKGRRHKTRYMVQEKYTLDDLIRLAMINSNNEATVWIGKHLAGGDLSPFIKRMNDKCASLGMMHTFYSNPSGLPAVSGELDNSSSPNDLLILSLELIRYQEILDITRIGYADIGTLKKSHVYRNHNGLVIQYPNDVDGLKTGYTKNARFCLVATATRGGRRLIGIVLGAHSPYERNDIVAGMMNNYYQVLGLGKLGDVIGDPNLACTITDSLDLHGNTMPVLVCSPNSDNPQESYRKIYVKSKKTHVVHKGETLFAIADKYNCYTSEIKKWNRLKSSHVNAGQKLIIYQQVEKTVAINSLSKSQQTTAPVLAPDKAPVSKVIQSPNVKKNDENTVNTNEVLKGKFVYHVVQPGDTLWNIAQRYAGTTVEKIKKVNKISNSRGLKPGTKLKIQVTS